MFKQVLESVKGKRVLIAPLDWGLGHATRCIPIIYELLNQHCEVVIAANGTHEKVLAEEFPKLQIIDVPNYNVTYAKSKIGTVIKLANNYKRIKKVIATEHEWLKKIVVDYAIEVVISDNRYGLWHQLIPCYFITHQLFIKSGLFHLGEDFMQKENYNHINYFTACWVPDEAGEVNFGGALSHPKKMPTIPVKYIGALTRLQNKKLPILYKAAIVLSGPEPQRTVLENIMIKELEMQDEKIILVRGLPNEQLQLSVKKENVTVLNYANAATLNEIIMQSDRIICRSGYTSVMDYLSLDRKCIFIPTPGQGEQEYLATYLPLHHNCISFSQNKFDLKKALQF
jgi:uncharacterized protein (TIGR00661 family)